MAKLVRTKMEWEGTILDELTVIEGEEPAHWQPGTEFRLIGKAIPRVDGPERVTGRAKYTFDIQLPGMLYAKVLRSPHPHARIKRLDLSRARTLPGVRAVVSHLNVPRIPWMSDTFVLEPIVRFVGDEVAAVAADDEYIAEDALRLIDVEYEKIPFVLDAEKALEPGAPLVHAGSNLIEGKPRLYDRGDVKYGFQQADAIVENIFTTQSALHNCLESHGVVAAWDGDQLTVWESTQSVYRVHDQLAEAFKLPHNKIRVICEYMGGGFGSKQYTGKWSFLAALLARQAGRPVQLMFDRREENLATGNRAPTKQHLKIGAKRNGSLTAIDYQGFSAIGAYGRMSLALEGPSQLMYLCPNVHSEVRSAFTNSGPARSFRGPGYTEGTFPLESLMDEMAMKLNLDPIELRMRNYVRVDQRTNRPYSTKHLDLCYQKGASMIGWKADWPVIVNGNKRRATGMAAQLWGGGGGPPAYAWVKINPDGTSEVMLGSQDIGTGTKTAFAQIAAEELGVPLDHVVVRMGDTASGPYDPVSWGSMSVSSVGPAIREAAADALRQFKEVTAGVLSVLPERVEIRDSTISVKGESKPRMKILDMSGQIGQFTILGRGSRGPNQPDVELRTFGAQFADVEVNTATGEVTVHKIVSVHDFGRVINTLGSTNQALGAVVQGIGYGLSEERVTDERFGVVLNPNLEDYIVPTALDIHDIDCAFVDIPDEKTNNMGAKGLGEPALIPTAPAIANAIARAIGIRFTSLPITREKILNALERSSGPEASR